MNDLRLPIDPLLPDIERRLAQGHLVLEAPPGSGKTTRVPLALRDAAWMDGHSILMLEPRRAAARMAARRMAATLGEPVGETVGYRVRHERRSGPRTRIEVVTDGVLLRRLQADPELSGVGLVIFDEFHERGLENDLALALCREVGEGLREDLRLLLMSASLEDGAALAETLGWSRLCGAGRCHPVEIRHLRHDPPPERLEAEIERRIRDALARHEGDLLVFLPGKAEIARIARRLEDPAPAGLRVQPLHGELAPEEQDAVIRGDGEGRRVVLATDLAETSLTVEGIRVVIDSGLQRRPRFDPGSGLDRLELRAISRAAAVQRAGRAGRTAPGHCYRLWSEARHARLEPAVTPEILHADLARTVLELAAWGVDRRDALPWLDPPPEAHWAQARGLLEWLGALDGHGRITATGRRLLALPLHPRLARMIDAAPPAARGTAIALAALIEGRDPLRATSGETRPCDLRERLEALRDGASRGAAWRETRRLVDELARRLGHRGDDLRPADAGPLLAAGFPDRIAGLRAGSRNRYRLRGGRGAELPLRDTLCGTPLLVAPVLDGSGRDARIRLAAPLPREALEHAFGERIETVRELRWDATRDAVVARVLRRLDALVLEERAVPLDPEDDPLPLLLEQARKRGLDRLGGASALRALQQRLALARRLFPEQDWPPCDDEHLLATLPDWLGPWLAGATEGRALERIDAGTALAAHLGPDAMRRLERLFPEHHVDGLGRRHRIRYRDGEAVLEIPVQHLYGCRETPAVAGGRLPLTLHLLSPAGRPLQITRDLAHFWTHAWREVRKEMRGRYPRHVWPEDPATAEPVPLGRRRPRC